MPQIVDYNIVLQTLLDQGLQSLYHNSGSFGFPAGVTAHVQGWIGPPDSTIRSEAASFTRNVEMPYAEHLTQLTVQVWQEIAPGNIWVMPRSHWAYELDFGSKDWMPAALAQIGIESKALSSLATGTAIQFEAYESNEFASFLRSLLDNLSGSSDFQLAWPGRALLSTVHHHKQLWWTTTDEAVFRRITGLF